MSVVSWLQGTSEREGASPVVSLSGIEALALVPVDSWVCQGGNNSVVECDLAKVEVAGSNPVSRSIFLSPGAPAPRLAACVTRALRRSLHSGRTIFQRYDQSTRCCLGARVAV